jgi:hypothetical protein
MHSVKLEGDPDHSVLDAEEVATTVAKVRASDELAVLDVGAVPAPQSTAPGNRDASAGSLKWAQNCLGDFELNAEAQEPATRFSLSVPGPWRDGRRRC